MELSYWISRWRKNKTGFHMPEGYPGLQRHWPDLQPESISTVLVPLCGKSVDLIWLSQHADKVIGVEIAEKAILDFMKENNRTWSKGKSGEFTLYTTGNIQFWQGDFLKLPAARLPQSDLIYDKAALTALPPQMRKTYAEKIIEVSSPSTRYLLHHFIYNQEEMNGPPFSIEREEIKDLFGRVYQTEELSSEKSESRQFPKFIKRGLKNPITGHLLLLRSRNNC